MLNEPPGREKIFQLISSPYGALIKAVILPFQGKFQPSQYSTTEHLLHEYKLNDKTLQKVQLKQHKIFQNFPTNPIPAMPNVPPLPTSATPKVSPLLEPNNSDNDSPETPLTPKPAILFQTIMISPWHRLIFAKNRHLLALFCDRNSLNPWLCNHKFLTPMLSLSFQF